MTDRQRATSDRAHAGPDAIALLSRDHAELKELFDRLQQPAADRPAVLRQLIRRLAAHVAAERVILYPVLKSDIPEGRELGDALLKDHHGMERLLVLIERRKAESPDVPEKATELLELLRSHAAAADERLFPALRAALSREELIEMGSKMSYDEGLVLSHPHPHLLSLGPINRLLMPLASVFDRLRDRTVTN
jgi:hemerythrin superfamily protein